MVVLANLVLDTVGVHDQLVELVGNACLERSASSPAESRHHGVLLFEAIGGDHRNATLK